MKIVQFIPRSLEKPLRKLRQLIRRLKYVGSGRHCPVCNCNSREFGKAGIIPREDAQCMHCGAVERHRLVWLYFKRKTDLFKGKPLKMLHVAPEEVFEKLLSHQLGVDYLTADLFNPSAMVKMDITDIQYPDESFDVIYCSHVLEHVADDRKAMREFFRVLKPNGWAILLVPIIGKFTFEDSSITDPVERTKLFGQEDHVRNYGRDYVDRLRSVGFYVEEVLPADFLSSEEMVCMAIHAAAGEIFLCKKQQSKANT